MGFGMQRDIADGEAVLLLRITTPRNLNVKALGEILVRYLAGGYRTLVLDQGPARKEKLNLLEFLGQLQVLFVNKTDLLLEKLIRESGGVRGLRH